MLRSLALSRRHASAALLAGTVSSVAVYVFANKAFGLDAVVLSFALAWASFADLERLALPDLITLGLVLVGLTLSIGEGGRP